jgi:tight adherence protein B
MSALSEVAGVTQRLAVLLGAGVAPASAWEHVAASTGSRVAGVVGADPPSSLLAAASELAPLEAGAWRGLAAAWAVATEAGAPLAPSLRAYAHSLRDLAQAQRDVRVALAAPIATARLVMALPIVGILFSFALGFDTIGVLLGTPIGWGCLAIGAGLMFAAARWNGRLVASAQPTEAAPGIECDLMAIAVSGGGSLDRALSSLHSAAARFALPSGTGRIDGVLELSRRAGVPAAELLRAEAEEARRAARSAAQQKAAALSVRLMLPLGLCILPAFVVLGVVPLLVAVVSSTVGAF